MKEVFADTLRLQKEAEQDAREEMQEIEKQVEELEKKVMSRNEMK